MLIVKLCIYILPVLITLYWVIRIFFKSRVGKIQVFMAVGMLMAALTLYYKEDTASMIFPFFYLAVRQKTSVTGVGRFDWLVLLPSILFLPYNHSIVFYAYIVLQVLSIMSFSIVSLHNYKKTVAENFVDSDILAENLEQILAYIAATVLVVFVMVIMPDFISSYWAIIGVLTLLLSMLLYLIGHYTYKFNNVDLLADIASDYRPSGESLETVGEPSEQKLPAVAEKNPEIEESSVAAGLLQRVIEEKMYLDPTLSLVSLASRLNTNRTYLSNEIHSVFHQNFSEFINSLRIEYAIGLMRGEGAEMSVKEIALSSGYSHIQSFYRHFMEIKQTTPKMWIDQNITNNKTDTI